MPKGLQGQKHPFKYVRDICMGAGLFIGIFVRRLMGHHTQVIYDLIPLAGMLAGFGVGVLLKRRLLANAQRP